MRRYERTRARTFHVHALLVVLAVQAITPDSQDLSSAALLQHLAALEGRPDGRVNESERPVLHHAPMPVRPCDSRDDSRGEGTPDELCLPAVAQRDLPIASVRDTNSPSGPSEFAAPAFNGDPGHARRRGRRAGASGAGGSMSALSRWNC